MRRLLLSLFRHQTLYWLRQDLLLLRRRARRALRGPSPAGVKRHARYLNLGCGTEGFASDEWLNVDGCRLPSVDCTHDLTRPFPFPDARFEGVYSEHFFEHLTPEEGTRFLGECYRVLRAGGVLRLSVPDGELYVRRYFDDRAWMLSLKRRGLRFRTPMEVLNEVFRQRYEHQYTYDFETLALALRSAGFVDVTRVGFGEGLLPALQIDQPSRRFESLYVEARHPL
jgi:predicted SAM-dependent methyltransferase